MKRIVVTLICLAIFSVLFVSCGHNDIDEESIAKTNSDTDSDNFISSYNGSFDEKVFEHIIGNINLKGIRISMPCTFAELSAEFELNENPYVDSEHSVVCYAFNSNDKQAGFVQYDSYRELTEEELKTETFCFLRIDPLHTDIDASGMYIAGLTTNDTYDTIIETLGNPTEPTELDSDDNGSVTYSVDDNRAIIFYLLNGKIESIAVINK